MSPPADFTEIDMGLFRSSLSLSGFEGDLELGLGAREVAATDNSIYHVRPAAIAYPRCAEDLNRIVQAANAHPSARIPLCPRGGNTGTNGQSLGRGVIIDFSRYMNRIIAIDADAAGGTVKVEPGVVLDQLNAALSDIGLFFPPMVSTASRATIGGMVATDASGKGSRKYGKTSNYVEQIELVLSDGKNWTVAPMSGDQAEALSREEGLVGAIHREVLRVARENEREIAAVFPDMNRGLTGYNLQQLFDSKADRFCLAPLLAGSEGTLAITKSITVRVIPNPAAKALAVVRYDSFEGGLRDVQRLLRSDPVAIEIIDDNVLSVARSDIIWADISSVLGDDPKDRTRAISFVEFAGSSAEVEVGLQAIARLADQKPAAQIDIKIVMDGPAIVSLWKLREKSVGLLAKLAGNRQGVPFVEDTAVPPHHLPNFVSEFRDVLDRHGLKYGMFGHADVGCLHVRPFLDMKDASQASLIRPISDEIAALTKSYGGLLWGEHGRGFRGEYSPFFFGAKLFPELCKIKAAFDPNNIMNPGKLATPDPDGQLDKIDAIPFRGELDGRIADELIREFDRSVACNGNGACFSWDAKDVMCPSFKATRDRAQSPKGRAALLRTWARMVSENGAAVGNREVHEIAVATAKSLSTCLSCKGCTTFCPVNIDVPSMKSRFFERFYAERSRPPGHYLLAMLEPLLAGGQRMPKLANILLHSAAITASARFLGFVDPPRFEPASHITLPPVAKPDCLAKASRTDLARTVILVEDTFTAAFDGRVMEAATELLRTLGYNVFRIPPRPNGKALYVMGMRRAFARIAHKRMEEIGSIADTGATLVGLDQATSLMFEQEYREFSVRQVRVASLDEFLLDAIKCCERPARQTGGESFRLLGHCTETALRPAACENWVAIFAHVGERLTSVKVGCCGMAGMFGHERKHQTMSKRLFDLSWRPALTGNLNQLLATGFSCRCQVERLEGHRPRHPVEALRSIVCTQ